MSKLEYQVYYKIVDNEKVKAVTLLLEDGKPTHYVDEDGDMFTINGNTKYFRTEEEANKALREMTPTREEILKVLNYFHNAEEDEFFHEEELKALLKEHGIDHFHDLPGFICKMAADYFDNRLDIPDYGLNESIKTYVSQGVLNIDARSFHKSEVSVIRWGEDSENNDVIEIDLENGDKLYARNKNEEYMVKLAFGDNDISGRTYKNMRIPE